MEVEVELLFENDYVMTFETQDILDFKVGNTIASDNTRPSWGIVGQYANLTLKDTNGLIDYLKTNRNIGFTCSFSLNRNSLGILFYMDKVSVDDEAHTVNISLVDGTERLRNIQKNKREFHLKAISTLLNDIIEYDIADEDFIDGYTLVSTFDMTNMFNGSLLYDFSSATNVYDALTEICQLTHTCMYIKSGKLEVVAYE